MNGEEARAWDRRQWLMTALGASVASLPGCRFVDSLVPPLPAGELVGANVALGHRARDFMNATLAPSITAAPEACDVLVIGAGVSGLSAARRLKQRGVSSLIVVDLESEAGGTARGDEAGAFPCPVPWGAHYIPAPLKHQTELVQFLSELGAFESTDERGHPIPREDWSPRAPESRFWFRGSWYEGLYAWPGASQQDLEELRRFEARVDEWVAWRDAQGRRAFVIPSDLCSTDEQVQALDRISMSQWLEREGFSSERLFEYVDYACRDDYGLSVELTSAWAGLFYFAARQEEPGSESRPYLTWPEGNGFVTRALASSVEDLRLGRAVVSITPQTSPTERARVVILDSSERLSLIEPRWIVFAVPQLLAPRLIAGYREAPLIDAQDGSSDQVRTRGEAAQEFQYAAWVVANLHLDRAPSETGHPLCWDNVIHGSESLGYLATSYQRGQDFGEPVWTWYYPIVDRDPNLPRRRLLDLGRDAWAEIALTDLERAHPDLRSRVKRLDVMRWGHAMIQPKPGFRFSAARTGLAQAWKGIHFAHSDLSGLPLFEEAFERGLKVADEVVEAMNQTASTLRPTAPWELDA